MTPSPLRSAPAGQAYPPGLPAVLDAAVRDLDGGQVLLGGEPTRLLRLRPAALEVLQALTEGAPLDRSATRLVRTLVDGGFAHPQPAPVLIADVTVVVPVQDRADELDRCLSALGRAASVVVVDDGSRAPAAVAAVAARHGALLVAQPSNTGPAGARNAGMATVRTPFVAFVDSDCVVPPDWLSCLLGHFTDPTVAAVAPRVRTQPGHSLLDRYAHACGPLDLGPRASRVRPGARVSYVPTASLILRREALTRSPFDAALRHGEDVDFVWRLHDAGWTVRYDPRVVVEHSAPDSWRGWFVRRHRYGTSAAPLSRRHPGRLTPLVLPPWPTAALLLLARRLPVPAAVAAAVPAVRLVRTLRRADVPTAPAATVGVRTAGRAALSTVRGLGGAGTVVTAPLVLLAAAGNRSRGPALAALVLPALLDHLATRPGIDPVRWTGLRLLDDLAYASGVWRSCLTHRTLAPLLPRTSIPADSAVPASSTPLPDRVAVARPDCPPANSNTIR